MPPFTKELQSNDVMQITQTATERNNIGPTGLPSALLLAMTYILQAPFHRTH
jgi:hypothetical protein